MTRRRTLTAFISYGVIDGKSALGRMCVKTLEAVSSVT